MERGRVVLVAYFFPPSRPIVAICSRFWLTIIPPFLPASLASSGVNSWAVPFAWAALPPLLAIVRCLSGSIDANPRLLVLLMVACSFPWLGPRVRQHIALTGLNCDAVSLKRAICGRTAEAANGVRMVE